MLTRDLLNLQCVQFDTPQAWTDEEQHLFEFIPDVGFGKWRNVAVFGAHGLDVIPVLNVSFEGNASGTNLLSIGSCPLCVHLKNLFERGDVVISS
jgi:hypothetical protein